MQHFQWHMLLPEPKNIFLIHSIIQLGRSKEKVNELLNDFNLFKTMK